MRTILAFLFLTSVAQAQTVNNATVNIQGANQNVIINQSSSGHTANFNLNGDNISVIASQSGPTPQSFSLSISCGSNCPNSPYIISQY